MDKRESNAIIFMLCLIVGILFVLLFFFLLEDRKMKSQLQHNTHENQKAALALRESREKLEKLLKTLKELDDGRKP
jgi:uncharacterized membrane protein (DUF106 family)